MHLKQPVLLINIVILVGVYGPIGISTSLLFFFFFKHLQVRFPVVIFVFFCHICIYPTFTECLLCARTTGDTEMNKIKFLWLEELETSPNLLI